MVICVWRARLYSRRQRLDHVFGGVGGGLHRHHARDLLGDRGVDERLEEPHAHGRRQQLVEQLPRVGRELVLDVAAAGAAPRRLPSG